MMSNSGRGIFSGCESSLRESLYSETAQAQRGKYCAHKRSRRSKLDTEIYQYQMEHRECNEHIQR